MAVMLLMITLPGVASAQEADGRGHGGESFKMYDLRDTICAPIDSKLGWWGLVRLCLTKKVSNAHCGRDSRFDPSPIIDSGSAFWVRSISASAGFHQPNTEGIDGGPSRDNRDISGEGL